MPNDLRAVMTDAALSSTARVAYWYLRSTSRNGYSEEPNEALSKVLGVNRGTVSLISKELTAAGLVRREPAGKGRGVRRWAILTFALAIAAGEVQPTAATNLAPQACKALYYQESETDESATIPFSGYKRRRRRRRAA